MAAVPGEGWDTDDDGLGDPDEFGFAAENWGRGGSEFGFWDMDDDGFLDDEEFGSGPDCFG